MTAFDLIINLFESSLIASFLYILSENNSARNKIAAVMLAAAEFIFITFVNMFSVTQGILTAIDILFCFLYLHAGAGLSKENAFLYAIIPDLLIEVSSTLYTMVLLLLLKQDSFYRMMSLYSVPVTIAINLIHLILFMIIAFRIRNKELVLEKNETITASGILLLCLILPLCFERVIFEFNDQMPFLFIGTSAVFLMAWMLWHQLIHISRKNQEKQKQDYEILLLKEERDRGKNLQEANEEIYRLRHDIKHLVSLLDFESGLISPDTEKESKQLLSRITETIQIHTPSRPLTLVLNMKREEAFKKEIDFKLSCNLAHPIAMDDIDLFLLISNILDNAIQHTGNGKRVTADISEEGDYCLIKVRNTVDHQMLRNHNGDENQRKSGEHGNGMVIIRRLIEQYDNYIDFYQKNNIFYVSALLHLKKTGIDH